MAGKAAGTGNGEFSYWSAVGIVSLFKLLFIKSYRSTDFEVHRNWLAITYSLPISKWYYEQTSQWTLDYPPFFAYLEWGLSQIAQFIEPKMLRVTNLDYSSVETILFQKISVVVLDLVLAFGVLQCSSAVQKLLPKGIYRSNAQISLFALIFTNGGLFIVDHIHFQYNGFLFGILLLSIAAVLQENYFQGAALFIALLNFKHIFIYIAPAYGIFYLSRVCWNNGESALDRLRNFAGLVGITTVICGASFGPFYQHIPQLLKRMFPFQRGLSHAYWAPNIWAGYNSLDLVLNYVNGQTGKSNVTSGLVGEAPLAVLPSILPIHTAALTVVFMIPLLWKLWRSPTELNFVSAVTLAAWTSFMFGYHVHEKAILNVIIPFALVAALNPKLFLFTLIPGTFSLFPLLFTPFEMLHKILICMLHVSVSLIVLPAFEVAWYELVYMFGFVPLYFLETLGPVYLPRLPFLPLLCISDYCFVGIFYTYVQFYWKYWTSADKSVKGTKSAPAPKGGRTLRSTAQKKKVK